MPMVCNNNTPRDVEDWDVELLGEERKRPASKRIGLIAAAAVLLVFISGVAVHSRPENPANSAHVGQAPVKVLEERRLLATDLAPDHQLLEQHPPLPTAPRPSMRRQLQTTGSKKVENFQSGYCGSGKEKLRFPKKGSAAIFAGITAVACEMDPNQVVATQDVEGAVGLVATLGVTAITLFAPGGQVIGPVLGMALQAMDIPKQPEEPPSPGELMILEQLTSFEEKLDAIANSIQFLAIEEVTDDIDAFTKLVTSVENIYEAILDPEESIYKLLEDPTQMNHEHFAVQLIVDAKTQLAAHWESSTVDDKLLNLSPWFQLIKLWDNEWLRIFPHEKETIFGATQQLCGKWHTEYQINIVLPKYVSLMTTIKNYSSSNPVKPKDIIQMLDWTGKVYDMMLSYASRKRAACQTALLMEPDATFESGDWKIEWRTFDDVFTELGKQIKTPYFDTYNAINGLSNGRGRKHNGPTRVAVCNDSKYPLRSYAIGGKPDVEQFPQHSTHSSFYPRVKYAETEITAKVDKYFNSGPVTVLERGECKWDDPEHWANDEENKNKDVKYWLGSECFYNFAGGSHECGWGYGGKYVGEAELSPLLYDGKTSHDDMVLFVVTDQVGKAFPDASNGIIQEHLSFTNPHDPRGSWSGTKLTWPREAPEAVSLDKGSGNGMLMLSGQIGEMTCETANVGNKNVGSDYVSNCGGLGDARLGDNSFETAFEMSVEQFMRTDFRAEGGLGTYYVHGVDDDGSPFVVTKFASKCGMRGRKMALEFHDKDEDLPRRVVMRATEDCFQTDENGSLAIGVEVGDYGTRLYIASGKQDGNNLGRGVCVHNNSWGQSTFNCDGDAKQRCGSGLFSQFADNDFNSCVGGSWSKPKAAFWNDPVVPGTADHAKRDEQGGTCRTASACIADNSNRNSAAAFKLRTIKLRIAKEEDRRSQVAEHEYKGCFSDMSHLDPLYRGRDLPVVVKVDGLATGIDFKTCAAECAAAGYKFFGRFYTGKCRCGNSYGKYGGGDKCNCANESNLGEWNVCVYSINEFDKPDARMAEVFGDFWGGQGNHLRDRRAEDGTVSDTQYAEDHGLTLKGFDWGAATPPTKLPYVGGRR